MIGWAQPDFQARRRNQLASASGLISSNFPRGESRLILIYDYGSTAEAGSRWHLVEEKAPAVGRAVFVTSDVTRFDPFVEVART